MKYIYHHLGLGDHIICNGLVRNLINPDMQYTMFVKPHNHISVSFMYRDIPNLEFIKTDDNGALNIIKGANNNIIIGFNSKYGISWDEFFYYQHNVDFNKRWDDFKVDRDFEREEFLFNKLNPENEKYILIHKNGSDSIDRINYDVVSKNIKQIYVENLTGNIFDYLKLSQNAEEVHCIESSFHVLIDSIELNKNLFFHTLKNTRGFTHKLKLNWKIV